MFKAIDQSIRGYSACQHTVSWFKGGVASAKNSANSLPYRIAACALQILASIACVFIEVLLFIPFKFLYVLLTPTPGSSKPIEKKPDQSQVQEQSQPTNDGAGRTTRRQAQPSSTKPTGTNPNQTSQQTGQTDRSLKTIPSTKPTQNPIPVNTNNRGVDVLSGGSKTGKTTTNPTPPVQQQLPALKTAPVVTNNSNPSAPISSSSSSSASGINKVLSQLTQDVSNVIVPQLNAGQGMATYLSQPWGFAPLQGLSGGTIFNIDIEGTYPDGSVPAKFAKDVQLDAFQKKHGVTFPLHLSKEHPVNAPDEVKEAAGIPMSAKAFQFIYPGALNMKFKDPKMDTPANRAEILDSLKEELRSELQQLLIIGGYFYHSDAAWSAPDADGCRSRGIAGINVLVPGSDPEDQETKLLYFGQAKVVTEEIRNSLATWATMTDRYYGPVSKKQKGDHPAMYPITVGPLKDEQHLSHFKWLEPEHPFIKQMCVEIKDPNFGAMGVFAYYSKEDPSLSCMLPIATPDQWKKLMRDTIYLKIDQKDEARVEAFRAEECTVCLEPLEGSNQPTEGEEATRAVRKVVRFNPCMHMNVCETCYLGLELEKPKKLDNCPSCRTHITHIDKPLEGKTVSFKPFSELGSFQLGLSTIDVDYLRNKKLNFLLKEEFLSPIGEIPPALRASLQIGNEFTQCSFLYPMYGKGNDLTCNYIGKVGAEIGKKNKDQNAQVLEGLVASGGFVLYDDDNQIRSVYGILPQNSTLTPERVLHLTAEKLGENEVDTITPEIAKSKDSKINCYNKSRITLENLLSFAKHFMWNGKEFVYSTGYAYNNWKATIGAGSQ